MDERRKRDNARLFDVRTHDVEGFKSAVNVADSNRRVHENRKGNAAGLDALSLHFLKDLRQDKVKTNAHLEEQTL